MKITLSVEDVKALIARAISAMGTGPFGVIKPENIEVEYDEPGHGEDWPKFAGLSFDDGRDVRKLLGIPSPKKD